jgi:WD40 repeat protein
MDIWQQGVSEDGSLHIIDWKARIRQHRSVHAFASKIQRLHVMGHGLLAISVDYGLSLQAVQSVYLFDLTRNQVIRTFAAHDRYRINDFAVSGSHLLTAGEDRKVRKWEIDRWTLIEQYAVHRTEVTGIAISGTELVSVSTDASLYIDNHIVFINDSPYQCCDATTNHIAAGDRNGFLTLLSRTSNKHISP